LFSAEDDKERLFDIMNNPASLVAVFFLPIVMGCGFSPAYQTGTNTESFLNGFVFSDPSEEADFLFLKAIEAKIQGKGDENYSVSYAVTLSEQSTFGERVNLSGTVNFTVKDLSSGEIIYNGSASNFVSHTSLSGLSNTISNTRSRDAALERLMNLLADSVRAKLIIVAQTTVSASP
jgi:LPS-assembly lipoprotein